MPRRPELLTRTQLVAPALALVRKAGGPVDALIREFALPRTAATDLMVVVPLQLLRDFLDAAARAAGDPVFGLHLPSGMVRGAYGLLEYIGRTARTVRDHLLTVVRYTPLNNEVADVALLLDEPGRVTFRHGVKGDPLAFGRHGNECLLAIIHANLRKYTGQRIEMLAATLAHRDPGTRAELEAHFAVPALRYGTGYNSATFHRDILELPIRGHDPVLHALLVELAETKLRGRGGDGRFLGQIRQTIRDQLVDALPSLDGVAAHLRINPRALQRRLKSAGTSFQELLESVREEVARARLTNPSASVGAVAFELHYSDESAFVRAFKRWTGTTPGAFRGRTR